jgi:hypothetical protein
MKLGLTFTRAAKGIAFVFMENIGENSRFDIKEQGFD